MTYAYRRASESCMSVDECTHTVGDIHIGLPHAVCVRHLRYVYTHARFLRYLYTYGRSLTGTDDWGRSAAIATLGDGVCTLTARPEGTPTRRDGQRVRQPTHLPVLMRHYKSHAHMISSIGFVHSGPCACPHVSHWLAQYSISILIYIYIRYIYFIALLFVHACQSTLLVNYR